MFVTEIPPWAALAQGFKEMATTHGPDREHRGDMPPVVFGFRDQVASPAFVSPTCDPGSGLSLLGVLRKVYRDRPMVAAWDMFQKARLPGDAPEPGQNQAEYEAGDLDVQQVLFVTKIDPDGAVAFLSIPYLYSGQGSRFVWLESQAQDMTGGKNHGIMFSAVRRIAAETEALWDEPSAAEHFRGMNPRMVRSVFQKTMRKLLLDQGYVEFAAEFAEVENPIVSGRHGRRRTR